MADDTTPEDRTTPAPRQRRRRATAPAGTPPPPSGGDARADEDTRAVIASAMAELGPPSPPDATPATPPGEPDADEPDAGAPDADAPAADEGVAEAVGGDDPVAVADQAVADRPAEAGDRGAGGRAMSVLFQAPAADDAPSGRRRRAVASAGPAQPALFSPPAAGAPDPGAPPAGPAEDAPDRTDAERPSRPRRRRKAAADSSDVITGDAIGDTSPGDTSPGSTPAASAAATTGDGEATAGESTGDSTGDEAAPKRSGARRGRTRRASGTDRSAESEDDGVTAGAPKGPQDSDDAGDPTDPEDTDEPDDTDDSDDSDDAEGGEPRRRRRRGGRGRRRRRAEGSDDADGAEDADDSDDSEEDEEAEGAGQSDDATDGEDGSDDGEDPGLSRSARRRRRRRRRTGDEGGESSGADAAADVTSVRGSTRLEAKRQRRREGRDSTRRRTVITEAEFLARRESVERTLLVRQSEGRTQIAVLEDGVLVEHYVTQASQQSMIGNVHLGKVQNVLPSMEAAFVDIGRGRNAVLYAGEVNWDAVNLTSKADRRIEAALKPGDPVLVQVTKDPIGHKGARLSSQVSLPGRFVVLVPNGSMTGISRKLPEAERTRLKRILKKVVPEDAGVIVRTAAEGAAEEDIERDVARLTAQWEDIQRKSTAVSAPALLYSEPDLAIRVVRDVFNEDINRLIVSGDEAWDTLEAYVGHVAPDLAPRLSRWEPKPDGPADVFAAHRVDEQIAKGLDRKVWLPSGGSLVIDRTEAMTVVDVNTGKFTGSGGDLEETVTRNNLEAAEEIVRQLRLRDIGGIIVVDFIDMVLESNRQLVLRRLVECLGRDRTKHQVAEVTSLGLVQMTRKRVGQGLLEAFSTPCETCHGRGLVVHDHPVESNGRSAGDQGNGGGEGRDRSRRGRKVDQPA